MANRPRTRAHGISGGWLYKLLARYAREGPAGLEPRSRRPHHSPARIAGRWEEEAAALRKELAGAGFDAGAATIHHHLAQRHEQVPSVATIWRILKARGFVTPQPHKRPKNSWKRFAAQFPNECWQADVTHIQAAAGATFEVLDIIDDHSRLCLASRAFATTRAADVIRTLHKAAATWGYPESFLTGNGLIFGAHHQHNTAGNLELELLALGIRSKHSRPCHPLCGKVERVPQTLKKYLTRQDPPATKKQLQAQLDHFTSYYNNTRPHRAIGRRTPATAYAARQKAHPTGPRIDATGYRARHDKLDRKATVTLRHKGRLHHIPVGRPCKGWRVILLINGLNIQVISPDGTQLRKLTLDPAKDYQPLGGA